MEEARQCRGFWRHAAILHAAAVEDCSLRAPGYSELKEAVARDCQAWTLSSSLLAIVGFAGLLVRPTPVRADVCRWVRSACVRVRTRVSLCVCARAYVCVCTCGRARV